MSRSGASAKASANLYENFFEESYPPLPLPMIWRVIYHEAVRGNHILWNSDDLASIEHSLQAAQFKIAPTEHDTIIQFMANLTSCGDFRELHNMIKGLPAHQKPVIFLLYRRALAGWHRWLKANLH